MNSNVRETLDDPQVKAASKIMLSDVLNHLGAEKPQLLISACMAMIGNRDYESAMHNLLEEQGVVAKFPEKIITRATLIYDQVAPHLIDGNIIDIGCGDGRVGKMMADYSRNIVLTDVYENPHVKETGLRFELGQTDYLPFPDNVFDNALLLTVLHHSDDPLAVIREAYRIVRPEGRVIVIESVYGVDGRELSSTEKHR